MLYIKMLDRNLYREKVIGGSILGDIWNTAKTLLTTGAKEVFSLGRDTGKNLLTTGAKKVFSLGRDAGKELFNQGKEALSTAVAKESSDVVNKLFNQGKEALSTAVAKTSVVDTIKNLTTNLQIKKILQEKQKKIDALHILSSVIAGSGVKRLK